MTEEQKRYAFEQALGSYDIRGDPNVTRTTHAMAVVDAAIAAAKALNEIATTPSPDPTRP